MAVWGLFGITRLWTLLFVPVLISAHEGQKIITAESGQDVTLTCRAPTNNIIVVEWSRADLGKQCVRLDRDGHFVPELQHPSFKDRVDLQDRQMKDGDVSVILKDVTTADSGTYECRVMTGAKHRRRALLKTAPISIITLSVSPPPPPPGGGGATEDEEEEDGGKEGGSVGLIVGLLVAAVLLLLAAGVGFLIYRKHEEDPQQPPTEVQLV